MVDTGQKKFIFPGEGGTMTGGLTGKARDRILGSRLNIDLSPLSALNAECANQHD